jgi:hypothetical protein
MASNLGAERSLTNQNTIEFDESNEDNIEEEVEANNENGTVFCPSCVFNYFHRYAFFFLLFSFCESNFMTLPLVV